MPKKLPAKKTVKKAKIIEAKKNNRQIKKYYKAPLILSAIILILIIALLFFLIFFSNIFTKAAPVTITQTDWSGNNYYSETNIDTDTTPGEITIDNNPMAWGLSGKEVDLDPDSDTQDQQMVPDGFGGLIIVWADNNATSYDIYAQRLDSDGNKLWGSDGVGIETDPTIYSDYPKIIPDGLGGAIITWYRDASLTESVYTQRMDSNGNKLWGTNGIDVSGGTSSLNPSDIVMIDDNNGGAFIGWIDNDIFVQRLDEDGNALWASPTTVCDKISDKRSLQITNDSSGNTILAWWDFTDKDIYAQKVNNSGSALWTANGEIATNDALDQNPPLVVPGSSNSTIMVWTNSDASDIYGQKIDSDGVLQWGSNGLQIVAASGSYNPEGIIEDKLGGAIFTWKSTNNGPQTDIYAQRIDGDGNYLWGVNGLNLTPDSDYQHDPSIAMDSNNNTVVTWADTRASVLGTRDIYGQKIDIDGNILWSSGGMPICTKADSQYYPKTISSDSEEFVVSWMDGDGPSAYNLYAQKITNPNNTVAELVSDVFESTDQIVWGDLDWQADLPNSSSIKFETRTSADNTLWSTWLSAGTVSIGSSGTLSIASPTGKYIQYKVTLNKGIDAPTLYEIELNGLESDIDGDGIGDSTDNCKYTPNPTQDNSDAGLSAWTECLGASPDYVYIGDDGNFQYTLPFAFSYFGRDIVTIDVDSNGEIELLESGETCDGCGDLATHYYGVYKDSIFAMNDDLQMEDGDSKYGLCGLGDKVIIQWAGSTFVDYSERINHPIDFQAIIYQNGDIQWNFQNLDWSGYDFDLYSGLGIDGGSDIDLSYAQSSAPTSYLWQSGSGSINPATLGSDDGIGDACDICPLDPDNTCDPDKGQKRICDAGGSISTADNEGTLDIPAGALSSCETITIEETPGPNFDITGSFGQAQAVKKYVLSPAGLAFNVSIEVTIDYTANFKATEVYYSPDNGTTWVLHGNILSSVWDSVTNQGSITFLTDHFSTFAIGASTTPPPAYTTPPTEEIDEEILPGDDNGEGDTGTGEVVVPEETNFERVMNSALPSFNSLCGVGYVGGRMNWAKDHRASIYRSYVDILRREPSAIEVNWWFAYSCNIDRIREGILSSIEYRGW